MVVFGDGAALIAAACAGVGEALIQRLTLTMAEAVTAGGW